MTSEGIGIFSRALLTLCQYIQAFFLNGFLEMSYHDITSKIVSPSTINPDLLKTGCVHDKMTDIVVTHLALKWQLTNSFSPFSSTSRRFIFPITIAKIIFTGYWLNDYVSR
jgi:hypothetical protein